MTVVIFIHDTDRCPKDKSYVSER